MLLEISRPLPDVLLGLYAIDEGRAAEREGVKKLLRAMLGYAPKLVYDDAGKPSIEGYHLSISHTRGRVVVALSATRYVGVDIEYQSDRVDRVASRFLRDDEVYQSTDERLRVWCVKEAVYKLFSAWHLASGDIYVDLKESKAVNLKNKAAVSFSFIADDRYIIALTVADNV